MKQYFEEKRIRPDILTSAVFWSVIIMMIYGIVNLRIYGDKGAGFVTGPLCIFYVLYLSFILAVQKSVWIMVRLRARRSQYLNAETNMIRSFRIFAVSGLFVGLILFAGSYFCSEYLFGSSRSMFYCMIVAICAVFMAIQGVLRGYMQGIGYTKPIIISDIIIAVVASVSGTVFSAILYNYGLKINNLFHVTELSCVYGGAGMMMGILVGVIAGFLQIVISFTLRKNEIKEIVKQGAPRYLDNKNDVLVSIRTILPLYISPALVVLIDFAFYIISQKNVSVEIDPILNYGVYAGRVIPLITILATLCSIPFVKSWNRIMVRIERDELSVAKDRLKAAVHSYWVLVTPITVFVFVMAKTIEIAVYGKNNDLSNYLIEIGSVLIILVSTAIFFSWFYNHMGKSVISMMALLLAFGLHIAMLIILVIISNLGVYGILISVIAGFLLYNIVSMVILGKMLKYRQELVFTVGIPLLCSAVAGLLAFVINVIFIDRIGDILTLLIALVLYYALYIVLMIIFKGLHLSEIKRAPLGSLFASLVGTGNHSNEIEG